MCLAMLAVFTVQDLTDAYSAEFTFYFWICYLPMVVYALMILVGDKVYRRLALILNDLENYRTEDEYEDFLITKIVIFQFVTAFGSLFYIAFVLRDMKRLQETLATLLITRQVTQNFTETVVPFMIEKLKLSSLTYKMTRSMSDDTLRRHVENDRNKRQSSVEQEDESPKSPGIRSLFSLGSPEVRQRKGVLEPEPKDDFKQLRTLSSIFREDFSMKTERLPCPEFKPNQDSNPEITQAELESVMAVYARPLDEKRHLYLFSVERTCFAAIRGDQETLTTKGVLRVFGRLPVSCFLTFPKFNVLDFITHVSSRKLGNTSVLFLLRVFFRISSRMNAPGTSRSHGSSNGTDRSRAVCREPIRAPKKTSRPISKENKRSKPAAKKWSQKSAGRYDPYQQMPQEPPNPPAPRMERIVPVQFAEEIADLQKYTKID